MKLTDLYQLLGPDEKKALALKAGIDVGYLWQIATRWRGKKPSIGVIQRLAMADSRLSAGELVGEFATQPQEPTHA